ncbi:DUF2690 domain-containing protein [Catellatospora chokoriensis]|uniref:DUF2690 domain-containing protein n=2 Tax=Catellatospora chokoriensis TaxID=310353 RepID=A0A8J3NSK6_9ACTN|nr:hypothetical protein Cch02nite_41000 [Catellatospora chokoriensis]
MQTHCGDDAGTAAYKDIPGARLEVRWSPRCKTNWARVTVYPTGIGCFTAGELAARQ